ncbi:HNH endonuclease [Bacteroides sp. GM023]|uniref:HNH endonuclease n=1 Tax=Bacteroides sp. GM023 TaxID=2723058 RepID=UPI00168C0F89|nr:HNH endonuclease [Bacteroides sp. GM023]MBD3590802.1 hypothetical protein [Bacteroides sp. GM023]
MEKKIFFDHITNMEKYSGFEQNVIGGGRYVDSRGFGHELFNFKNDNGKCYGYTAPHCRVNLNKISKIEICQDAHGKYLDDVLVIFTCQGKNGKRVIAGFYQKARVYEKEVSDKRTTRIYNEVNINYNLICDASNAVLISQNDRNFEIPSSKSNNGSGHGQSNIWYANKDSDNTIRQEVIQYVNDILTNSISEEHKYNLYDEKKSYIATTQAIKRSKEARNKCIELKGCKCNICGFDFQQQYGELGKDYIEVHHIISIKTLSNSVGYEGTDPQKDLIPLCSNCHSMVHRMNPPYKPEEIIEIIKKYGAN